MNVYTYDAKGSARIVARRPPGFVRALSAVAHEPDVARAVVLLRSVLGMHARHERHGDARWRNNPASRWAGAISESGDVRPSDLGRLGEWLRTASPRALKRYGLERLGDCDDHCGGTVETYWFLDWGKA